jgi:hypothetical protein
MLALVVDNTQKLDERKLWLMRELKKSGIYMTQTEVNTLIRYEAELDAIEAGEQRFNSIINTA